MPTQVNQRSVNQVPDSWQAFGHSWLQHATGPSGDQTGRTDAMFRSAMDIEWSNWRNYALSGAVAIWEQRYQGGWPRVWNSMIRSQTRTFPYAPDGGGSLICYGVNDMGRNGGQDTLLRTALADTHRAIISRCRSSVIWEDSNTTRHTYGGTWTTQGGTGDNCSGTSLHSTTTTGATITLTLPSDYKGEPVVVSFLGGAGTTNGSVAFSGTAGYAGASMTLDNRVQAAWFTHIPVVRRITGLTAANAGQTVVMTITVSSGGTVFYDCAWLEALSPPPVIVLNTARLTAAGYANSFYTSWTGTEASKDSDVQAYNALLTGVVAEFDGMVQLVDVDTIINKDSTKTSDGIHPNEYGAGPIVDAIIAAKDRMNPPTVANGRTLPFNSPSPRVAPARQPRMTLTTGWWHRPIAPSYASTYTPVAGHMFAMPFAVSEARELYDQFSILTVAAGTVAPTIRWAIYDDVNWTGHPNQMFPSTDPTASAVFTPALTATSVQSQSIGLLGFIPDPGLYWLVLKVDTAGTSQTWQAMTGQSDYMPTAVAAGTGTTSFCAWQLTGQAAGVLPGNFPGSYPSTPTATPVATAPFIQMRKIR